MAQMRRENTRVIGRSIGNMANRGEGKLLPFKGLTDEQKAQRQRDTQASYEVWLSEREARKAARYRAMRSRNL